MSPAPVLDAVIVGAGLAGATAALVLKRRGFDVALVDPRETCAPVFKAEKIEADQAELLRELGVWPELVGRPDPVGEIRNARDGRVLRSLFVEQYGISYHGLVDAVRRLLPPGVLRIGRVDAVETGGDTQRVLLAGGEALTCRLVVLANGTGGRLHGALGLEKHMVRPDHSLAFGFDLEQPPGCTAPTVTCYPSGPAAGFGYLTTFPMDGGLRANVFVYWAPRDPRVRRFLADPAGELARILPGLGRVFGPVRALSKVQTGNIDLYTVRDPARPGLVLIGDAFQSVCPSTGTGLSKVLTDVAVLCARVPAWLSTPGMGVEKIAGFYADPRKRAADAHSLHAANYQRQLATDTSLRFRLHREKVYLEMGLLGLRERLQRRVATALKGHSSGRGARPE